MATKYFVVVNIFKFFFRLGAYSLYYVCWKFQYALNCMINRWVFSFNDSRTYTAQIGWVLWKKKFSVFSDSSPMDFLCMFRKRVRPEYVHRQTVSLYAITRKEALFVETPEGIKIYSSDVHPFFVVAQLLNAAKVIKMSIREFVSLAENIGDPTVPIIWMSNTGRCGGTMVCQVFESVPGTLAIHEPDPPTNVHVLNRSNKWQVNEYNVVLKSMLRIMCKPRQGITRICIKPRPQCTGMITNISKLGLDIKLVFRNSLDTLRSWLAVMSYDPFLVCVRLCTDAVWFSNILPYMRNICWYYYVQHLKGTSDLRANATVVCVLVYSWANQVQIARGALLSDRIIMSVKYEDILSQPTKVVKQLFERSGVDTRYVERAIATLSRDSQRNTCMSRANLYDASHRNISELDRIKCVAILKQYNLPPLGEDFRLDTMF